MEPVLKLKSFAKSIEIQINDTGVSVIEKSLTNYHEYHIEFDQFTTKRTVKREINNGMLFFVFICAIITLIKFFGYLAPAGTGLPGTIIFLSITLFFIVLAFTTKKQIVVLTKLYGQTGFEIPFKNSNEKEVREFADLIIEKTKEYLISKYGNVDKDMPRENQFENIISLKDRNIITEKEFERLKNILLDKDAEKKIGF
jgi:hypothetical protein